jgi:zinc protease
MRKNGQRRSSLRRAQGSALPGADDITRAVLPNGIVVLARANFNSQSVTMSGHVDTGGIFEPDEKLGLADFTAAMLMRGTGAHSSQEIYELIEGVGASLGFSSGTHTTGFSGRSLAEDLPIVLGLLAEALRRPTFPAEQVERLRSQLLTGLAIRAQDTSEMASLTFDEIVFAHHPYARPEDGFPETIRAITREEMAEYHRAHFGPKGMVVAVVGAVEPAEAVDQVARVVGDWENPGQPDQPPLPPLTPLTEIVRRHVSLQGKVQADLILGAAGPRRRDPEYMAAALGNSVLGQFGMMGRIGDVVREQSGLAYYAYSSMTGGTGPGSWEVSAGVNPENVEKAIDLIRSEIRQFTEQGVTAEELTDSQANFIGRLPLSLESNAGVAGGLLKIERFGHSLDYYRQYADLVREVSVEQVVEAARKYLHPDRLAIATAGP